MVYKSQIFEIQGHRGCRGLMPENTLPAFQKALELAVNTLEMDVVISKDRKVIVSHEPYFHPDFSTNPEGVSVKSIQETNIFLMNYEEIRLYDIGKSGNSRFPEQAKLPAYKPLLSEVIMLLKEFLSQNKDKKVGLNIELKSLPSEYGITQPEPSEFVDLVLKELVDLPYLSLQSFDFNVLKCLFDSRKADKKYDISVLIEPEDNNEIEFNLEKLGFKPDIWSPNYSILTKDKVDHLHDKGLRVIPWTVNEVSEMEKMLNLGCDGIITDYPDRALNFINNQ